MDIAIGMKLCNECRKTHPISMFYNDKSRKDGLYPYCKPCDKKRCLTFYNNSPARRAKVSARTKELQKYRKQAAVKYYGGKCACCGELESVFLTIDHINNDGAEHRRQTNGAARNIYRWLEANDYPEGFQVLCMNCNFGKHMNGGTCPHKTREN